MRAHILDAQSNVINSIVVDAKIDDFLPDGCTWGPDTELSDKAGPGWRVENGEYVPDKPDPTLDEIKAKYKKRVDKDAEAKRLLYVTPGAGMALTYREKFEQAQLVNDLGQANADALTEAEYEAAYPVLAASVGIEANTLWECAQIVIQRYVAFAGIANAIEKTRLAGKKAIQDAVDNAGVVAAYGAITWTV